MGFVTSGRLSGAMCPPSGIERNDQCGHAAAKMSTISRMGRRVPSSLTSSVRAGSARHSVIGVSSS